ncbi:hypothetical protein DFJ73DRAFT_869887 [Zopfochytrium polystomum]|nr:hypothetical protein DFJ73DRAFT_869887 [Zopfochytrium polystomum]
MHRTNGAYHAPSGSSYGSVMSFPTSSSYATTNPPSSAYHSQPTHMNSFGFSDMASFNPPPPPASLINTQGGYPSAPPQTATAASTGLAKLASHPAPDRNPRAKRKREGEAGEPPQQPAPRHTAHECLICSIQTNAAGNRIVACSSCHKGYHQLCHVPPLPDSLTKPKDRSSPWVCSACIAAGAVPNDVAAAAIRMTSASSKSSPSTNGGAIFGLGFDPTGDLFSAPRFPDGTPSCLACYQPLEAGVITTEFFESSKPPTRVEDVWPNVFRRLCSLCRPQMKMRQGLISQLSPIAITTIVLQCAVRYVEVGQLLKSEPNATTMLNFSYRAPASPPIPPTADGLTTPPAVDSRLSRAKMPFNGFKKRKERHKHVPHPEGNYENMIAKTLSTLNEPKGTRLKNLFNAMESTYHGLPASFRQSASQALKKGIARGRFIKVATAVYRLNNDYVGRPSRASKKGGGGDGSGNAGAGGGGGGPDEGANGSAIGGGNEGGGQEGTSESESEEEDDESDE